MPIAPARLLDTMSINAAQALGQEAELGSIEVGKFADLVIIDADATSGNIANSAIMIVIKNGRIVVDQREH